MDSYLVGFIGDVIKVEGMVTLTVSMGHYPLRSIIQVDIFVIRVPSAFNAILEKLGLNTFWVVFSTYYLKIKFW